MKPEELLTRHNQLLHHLSVLPKKMIGIHGHDNVTEFVLHELCHEDGFNFDKAAYIVDNPDFNCLKGIAGITRHEAMQAADIWDSPDRFSLHMQQSPFNQHVRRLMRTGLKHDLSAEDEIVQSVAHDLGFKSPAFCSWHMKHNNRGLLFFEKNNMHDVVADDHLLNALHLLSFCPIF